MRAQAVGSLAVGVLLLSSLLAAQLPQGTPMPGPRMQMPVGDAAAQPATGTARIQGRVVAADTGVPLRRAQVRIFANEQRVNRMATTDADGRYQIRDLPSGRYNINVARNRYVSLQFGQQRPFEPGKPLELADGRIADRIDFALPRGGVITGRITDEVGEAIAGVGVAVMRYQYTPEGKRQLMPAAPQRFVNNLTNDLGELRLYGLMPGSYIVSAQPNGMGGMMVMPGGPGGGAVMFGANDGSDGFAPTYYPGTPHESEAQPLTVSIGQETSVSFALIPTRLARISGTIRTSRGQPAANAQFGIRSGAPGNFFGFGGSTGSDGTFQLMNVPPGEYILEVRPRMMGRGAPMPEDAEFASVPLAVGGEDVTNLMIVTGRGATVSGRVIFEGGTQQAAAQEMSGPMGLRVMFISTETNAPAMMMGGTDNGAIGPDGQFQLTGLTGRATFRVSTSPQWGVKSVTLEGSDITDTPHDIKAGAQLSNVDIVITNVQSTVSGAVRTASGELAKDYVAVFLPANLRDGDIPTRFVRTARPDQDGKYQIKGLPPADYFAVAVGSLEQGGQWDPEFQERARPRGERFTIREGQTVAVDLTLQP